MFLRERDQAVQPVTGKQVQDSGSVLGRPRGGKEGHLKPTLKPCRFFKPALKRRSQSNRWIIQTMLLIESLPDLSRELSDLLIAAREPGLAAQIDHLEIAAKCSCTDDFCASFYTAPKPVGSYGPKHRNLELAPVRGMIRPSPFYPKGACEGGAKWLYELPYRYWAKGQRGRERPTSGRVTSHLGRGSRGQDRGDRLVQLPHRPSFR
jgi:hypothetical protein